MTAHHADEGGEALHDLFIDVEDELRSKAAGEGAIKSLNELYERAMAGLQAERALHDLERAFRRWRGDGEGDI